MKVCKFGGSSLADAGQLTKVIDIVLSDPQRRIVVVSAPGKRNPGDTKVTDLLIALAKCALDGKNTASALDAVVARYAEIAKALDLASDTKVVADFRNNLLLLFRSEWSIDWALEHNKGLILQDFGNA